MNRKISLGAAVTLAIMFSTVTFITTMIYAQKTFDSRVFNIKERETMYAKLAEVDRLVRQKYFNTIDEDFLGENLVRGYVAGMQDQYGMYLTAEQYSETQSNYEGRLVDIGIVCTQDPTGYIRIEEVYAESPAAVSELARGDLIVKVDDLAVTADNYAEAVDALRGEPGTTVTVLARRDNVEKSYTITRRKVEVPTAVSRMIGNVGYLRIKEFNDNTPEQFNRAVGQLLDAGALAFVFDVRGNPGGTIESVSKILDRLLPEGPIVSATYRNGTTQVLATSTLRSLRCRWRADQLQVGLGRRAVRAGAQGLQQGQNGGHHHLRKGSMQEIHKLSDGRRSIHRRALQSALQVAQFRRGRRQARYEVKIPAELEKELENLDENSDLQLKKALDVVDAMLKDQAPPPPPEIASRGFLGGRVAVGA
jgi:carboxyl-terminal processing protease